MTMYRPALPTKEGLFVYDDFHRFSLTEYDGQCDLQHFFDVCKRDKRDLNLMEFSLDSPYLIIRFNVNEMSTQCKYDDAMIEYRLKLVEYEKHLKAELEFIEASKVPDWSAGLVNPRGISQ